MIFSHDNSVLPSLTTSELRQFVLKQRERWTTGTPDFERFEHELREHIMAIECELLAEELARYDVTAEQIEVDGVTYR